MNIVKALLISSLCVVSVHAKSIDLHVMIEGEPQGEARLLLSHDYPGKYHDVLLEQVLTNGLNHMELDDQHFGSDVFYQISANGFQWKEGEVEDLMNGSIFDRTIMLFREREVLLDYVISEDGRTFDESDTIVKEAWISDRQAIPIVDEDFQLAAIATQFWVSYFRVQDGFGVYNRKLNGGFDEIREAPEGPYVYENPTLVLGKPYVFKICGCPQREETYAKIVAKDIRLKAKSAETTDSLREAAWKDAEFAMTSKGECVGVMNPPVDRALVYFSDFDLRFPGSVRFDNYGDQDNLKAAWLSFNESDLAVFLESNDLDPEIANVHPRSEFSLPVVNTRFPNEKWIVDYIIQPDPVVIRITIRLESTSTRETQSKAFAEDIKKWSKNRVMIID